MAVTSPALTASIIGVGKAVLPGSPTLPQIATAVGSSLPLWLFPFVGTRGITTGVAGTGVATGKVFFRPSGQVSLGFSTAGFNGPSAPLLAQAVEQGTAATLNASAQYAGRSTGVSAGVDICKVTRAPFLALLPIMISNVKAAGINGPTSTQLATGLAIGISLLVRSGLGFGGVAPVVPAPAAAAGTSRSRVF